MQKSGVFSTKDVLSPHYKTTTLDYFDEVLYVGDN